MASFWDCEVSLTGIPFSKSTTISSGSLGAERIGSAVNFHVAGRGGIRVLQDASFVAVGDVLKSMDLGFDFVDVTGMPLAGRFGS